MDVRAHEVPKKLSESSGSSQSSSALRKGSMATLFKSLSGQIQNPRRGRARSETKAARLMRSKASEDPKMAVIHSDTDTDTDNKRFGSRSLDRSRVKRNESNSSADYLSRNNSHKVNYRYGFILIFIILVNRLNYVLNITKLNFEKITVQKLKVGYAYFWS